MAQCHATSKGSGAPCKRQAIAGAAVCRAHGGAAPQVKAAARSRLLALVDPALAMLARAVRDTGSPTAVGVRAATEILNRAGLDVAGADVPTEFRAVITFVAPNGEPISNDAMNR